MPTRRVPGPIKQLKFDVSVADIVVVGNDSEEIRVDFESNEPSLDLKNSILYIEDIKLSKEKEPVKLKIYLPKKVDIDIHCATGSLTINQMSGKIRVSMDSGQILGVSPSKEVNIDLQRGQINLQQLTGNADIRVDFGDVNLGFNYLNSKNKINVETASGDLSIQFPVNFLLENVERISDKIANKYGTEVNLKTKKGFVSYSEDKSQRGVEALPSETLEKIFGYLRSNDFLSARRVCTRWNSVGDSNYHYLWKNIYLQRFPKSNTVQPEGGIDWKQKYIQESQAAQSAQQYRKWKFPCFGIFEYFERQGNETTRAWSYDALAHSMINHF